MKFIKKLDLGGIKHISAEHLQDAMFNENLEDTKVKEIKKNKKINSRERLAIQITNEDDGNNFKKLYSFLLKMTEEEFLMFENLIRPSLITEANISVMMPSNKVIDSTIYKKHGGNFDRLAFSVGFKAGFNYYKKAIGN